MPVTITLPKKIETQLEALAEEQHLPVEKLALDILNHAVEVEMEGSFPTPEEVVARIKALPPNPHGVHPAKGSLAKALRDAPDDPDFDVVDWNKKWTVVEAEMKAITRANDAAEGRG
jgi:hypothetical protein